MARSQIAVRVPPNYWLLQLNKENIDDIRNQKQIECRVTRYADEMKVGDKVLLWLSENDEGIYANAEIAEIIEPDQTVSKNTNSSYCIIRFTSKLLKKPLQLRQEDLEKDEKLKELVIHDPNGWLRPITKKQWWQIQKLDKVIGTKRFIKEKAITQQYQEVKRFLDNRRNWKGYKSRYWKVTSEKKISEFHQFLIIEVLYQLWILKVEEDNEHEENNSITHIQIILIILEQILGKEKFQTREIPLQKWASIIEKEREITLNTIDEALSYVDSDKEKKLLATVMAFITNENPILWLKVYKGKDNKNYYTIKLGSCFKNFCTLMTKQVQNRQSRKNRYKAPNRFSKKRKRGGRRIGNFFYTYYGELDLPRDNKTEKVFEILERRHLWLDKGASEQANKMTEHLEEHRLTPFDIALYNNLAVGGLTAEKRERIKNYLSRNDMLKKLISYRLSDRRYPLRNRFYSQTSGRIQPQYLHPEHISEKIGQSDQYPGGVRQAIFCATKHGGQLSASDCCASAWQLASLFLSDEKTKEIACGEEKNFNTEMTKKALNGDYFDQDKLTEKGKDEKGKKRVARELVKKLLMTTLYGSSPHEHLKWANNQGYGGI